MKKLTKIEHKKFSMLRKILMTAVVSISIMSSQANDKIETETPAQHQANIAKARSMLQARGYQVSAKIDLEECQGQKALKVSAIKNGYDWDVCLSYPALKILQERRIE